jgi:hypothetical protein
MTIHNAENVEELEMADRTAMVKKYEALELLTDETTEAGKAFKILILDGYLKERAAEVTSLLAVPAMQPYRSVNFEQLAAISQFEQYLSTVYTLGAPANEDEEIEG